MVIFQMGNEVIVTNCQDTYLLGLSDQVRDNVFVHAGLIYQTPGYLYITFLIETEEQLQTVV